MDARGHAMAGQQALRAGRWGEARDRFASALALDISPEALDGMAQALWWLCEPRASARFRERAHLAHLGAGDGEAAARAALELSITYLVSLGNEAASRGWLARAERVLTGAGDDHPLRGWLLMMDGYLAAEPERAETLMRAAVAEARGRGDPDLELLAGADLGLLLVTAGRVEEGLTLLDEAMAGTLAGACRRLDTVVYNCCSMLAACSLLGDIERASQWCRVADDFMVTYGCPFLHARCRAHYGGVLVARGRWDQAEKELLAALDMAVDAGPGPQAEARAWLADLRSRQGRIEEAEVLVDAFADPAAAALPAASVLLARGRPQAAVSVLERALEAMPAGHVGSPPALALLVDAHLAGGDVDSAGLALDRLERAALAHPRPHPRALAALAAAHVATARGETHSACGHLEAALGSFCEVDLPFEAARTRLELAGALLEEGRPELAADVARAAFECFDELGAAAGADAAAALLRSLGGHVRRRTGGADRLTARELAVLDLVGQGLSNPEIAERLYISRKTAANHVSHVLVKLGLRNRAEAAAYSARRHTVPGRGGLTQSGP